MKIYINTELINAHNNPEEFLYNYITEGSPKTYIDKECLKTQCFGGDGRSFHDLFRLTKTYYPDLKLDEFAYIFIKLMKEFGDVRDDILDKLDETIGYNEEELDEFSETFREGDGEMTFIFCPDIYKVVVFSGEWNREDWAEGKDVLNFDLDGYGAHPNRHINGGRLSFENILKMANSYEEKIKD